MESTRSRLASGSFSGTLCSVRVVSASALMADDGGAGQQRHAECGLAGIIVEPERCRCTAQAVSVGESAPLPLDALPVGFL